MGTHARFAAGRTRAQPGLAGLVLLGVVLLVLPATLHAEDETPAARASRLRGEADTHWHKQEYAKAAQRLREAAALYEVLEPLPAGDLAITLRALVWNEGKAGNTEGVHGALDRLIAVVRTKSDLQSELANAWGGCWAAVTAMSDKEDVQGFMGPIRERLLEAGHEMLAAQVAHSWGSRLRDLGDFEGAAAQYETAVAERERLEDGLGLTWSLNNTANLYLVELDKPIEAMAPLLRAFDVARSRGVSAPLASIRWNVRKLATSLDGLPSETRVDHASAILAFYKGALKIAASNDGARVVSPTALANALLAEIRRPEHAARFEAESKALLATTFVGVPAAVGHDLTLRVVDARLDALPDDEDAAAKQRAEVATLLASVPTSTSGVGAHLRARRLLAEARLALAEGDTKALQARGDAALAAWESLGDRSGLGRCLDVLAAATTALTPEAPIEAWIEAHERHRTSGVPGGSGSSAMSSGDRTRARDLSAEAALFMLDVHEGVIRLADVAAKVENTFEILWEPRRVAMNGLSVQFFGCYVTILGLNYGGPSVGSTAPGTMTLDEAGDYLPLPPKGQVLVIQKNGAVRYVKG